jgi:hypothetical protein
MSNVLDFQVNGLNPSTVGGIGTTVKFFQRILGTNGPSSGPNTNISATNAAGALFLPANGVFNGQVFEVILSGDALTAGDPSNTYSVQLYAVTGSSAAPIYTSIATTGTDTPGFVGEPWNLSVYLAGTTNGGVLGGFYEGFHGNTVIAATPITQEIGGLNFLTGNTSLARGAVLGFVVGATFGTSQSQNTASLYQFTIES